MPEWSQRYLSRLIDGSGAILVNCCLSTDGASVGTARLRSLAGPLLAERTLPTILPMGALRISTLELFPNARQLLGQAECFALEFSGSNLASPFSYYQFANGKFSLHHF